MKRQNRNDRLDESLGMRNGPERGMKQSYKDRRDESRGMRRADRSGGYDRSSDYRRDFNIRDNEQASQMKYMKSDNEQYDMGRMQWRPYENRGQAPEAYNYEW